MGIRVDLWHFSSKKCNKMQSRLGRVTDEPLSTVWRKLEMCDACVLKALP